jgi:hypothetical protein
MREFRRSSGDRRFRELGERKRLFGELVRKCKNSMLQKKKNSIQPNKLDNKIEAVIQSKLNGNQEKRRYIESPIAGNQWKSKHKRNR